MQTASQHVLVTGGAGYIGSLLTATLLGRGYQVTVFDKLLFGGEPILAFWRHPRFRFVKGDVAEPVAVDAVFGAGSFDAVVHLAAIVGFPACDAAGRKPSSRTNVEGTAVVFDRANRARVPRIVFASSYSNYGRAENGQCVNEASPLHPQSVYAETKVAAERLLIEQGRHSVCAPVALRFATLFGVSPRTRFDLIINQFVLEAFTTGSIVVFNRQFCRSFLHVFDACQSIIAVLEGPLETLRAEVFNVGSERSNLTKDQIAVIVQTAIRGARVEYADAEPIGDMRNLQVSFAKIRRVLHFDPAIDVDAGVREIRDCLESGIIPLGQSGLHRNAERVLN